MKKWYGSVLSTSLLMLLVLGYHMIINPIKASYIPIPSYFNTTNPLEWINSRAPAAPPALYNPVNASQLISTGAIISDLFAKRNLSNEELNCLHTWNCLKHLISHAQGLPNAIEAIKEASVAWSNLMSSTEEEKLHMMTRMGAYRGGGKRNNVHIFLVPCGLTQVSSITIIGIPNGLLGNFRIDLTGEQIPGEPEAPIILHYNVRLHGDKITDDPVIVQNTWTALHDWGEEERCPPPSPEKNKKVDALEQCSEIIGKDDNRTTKTNRHVSGSSKISLFQDGGLKNYFPFRQNDLFIATLRVGSEGNQMTVDGKHITSFGFRETLEPWVVSEARISGDINLISVVASGLPTSEDLVHIIDSETLKATPLLPRKQLKLFVGVFSTANNFKRRMAVRRSWMQYAAVRPGQVAVCFFVGLHKTQMVNEELWNEARTYKDIQLMPFVDYYSLITWKTIAICIFGAVSAKFVMKTDDDAFVCVNEILASLDRINVNSGLLYGLISSDSRPHRNPDSKWNISPEVTVFFYSILFHD
ncbi:beta-1,3-galactosyltransferase GALT1 [Olea europaea subsp. europaea]|uniref:Beta-1,3-galactosyltransferase GALT1 n=1 Tax=Olea europaea subsp. europaea TaxID=158383 RepID=A0A8S0PY94_OLEEU|nr:beta-1,3-galactosyltransferase GALT1 [Olea europaea subsp. europaea]